MTWDELRPELAAGRLVASYKPPLGPIPFLYAISISAQAYFDWIAHTETPERLVVKVVDAVGDSILKPPN